ncbi:hypothetical protein G6F22_019263 [Rhizopus arrhizus]|nr:hypothetical protein G6F22_019263 [Rhizopus arrhizus]
MAPNERIRGLQAGHAGRPLAHPGAGRRRRATGLRRRAGRRRYRTCPALLRTAAGLRQAGPPRIRIEPRRGSEQGSNPLQGRRHLARRAQGL